MGATGLTTMAAAGRRGPDAAVACVGLRGADLMITTVTANVPHEGTTVAPVLLLIQEAQERTSNGGAGTIVL